jgi:hypothetical protein
VLANPDFSDANAVAAVVGAALKVLPLPLGRLHGRHAPGRRGALHAAHAHAVFAMDSGTFSAPAAMTTLALLERLPWPSHGVALSLELVSRLVVHRTASSELSATRSRTCSASLLSCVTPRWRCFRSRPRARVSSCGRTPRPSWVTTPASWSSSACSPTDAARARQSRRSAAPSVLRRHPATAWWRSPAFARWNVASRQCARPRCRGCTVRGSVSRGWGSTVELSVVCARA